MSLLLRTEVRPAEPTTRARTRARALGVGGAVLAAVAVWVLAVPVLGVELLVARAGEVHPVGGGAVVASSLVAGLTGWGLLALLERLSCRARPVWTAAALAVLVLSLVGPQGGVTTAATVTLTTMHLAVAAVLVPALTKADAGVTPR